MKGPSAQRMAKDLNIDGKYAWEIKRLMDKSDADKTMEHANYVMMAFGVEPVHDENAQVNQYWQNTIALYVNRGDTYDTTLLYDTDKDRFYITSWGDWYEKWQSKHLRYDSSNNVWKPKFYKV